MVNGPASQPNPGSFAIPAANIASHPDVIRNVRELQRWIDSLPLANPAKAGNQLLHQLRLLTRDPQPGSRFGALLDMYYVPLEQLLMIVNERLPGSPESALPLDQLESVLVELLTELACGHLRIANQLLASGKAPATETLFRAVRLLDSALNIERLHYRRLALHRWQLMVSIFLHADYQQVADQQVDPKLRKEDEPDTIQGLYFRTLLISLCDPHQKMPSEVIAWHRWTTEHTGLLSITLLPQGAFAIPIDIGGTLSPLASARRSGPGTDTRYLDGDRFMQQLDEDPSAPAGLRQALIGLIKGRQTPEQRQTERQPRNHPYQLIYGLRNIHLRLEELTRGSTPSRSEVRPVPCKQVNQSKFGAAFQLRGPLSPPLNIGEPILAEAEASLSGAAPVGFAARIRRVFSGENQQIEIGVEKIQGRLIPATIVGSAAERTRGDNLALLQHSADTGKYTLLASRSIYREGDSVAAEGPSMRYNLRMLRLGGIVQHTAYIDVEPIDG